MAGIWESFRFKLNNFKTCLRCIILLLISLLIFLFFFPFLIKLVLSLWSVMVDGQFHLVQSCWRCVNVPGVYERCFFHICFVKRCLSFTGLLKRKMKNALIPLTIRNKQWWFFFSAAAADAASAGSAKRDDGDNDDDGDFCFHKLLENTKIS